MTQFKQLSPATRGALLIAIAAALWATTSIAAKTLFNHTDLEPLTLACLRLWIAFPLFFILMMRERASRPLPRGKKVILPLLALGCLQGAYQGTYLWAVDLTGASIATLVTLCLAPVLVAIVAAPLLGERPNRTTIIALVCAIFGTLLLVSGDMQSADSARIGGVLVSVVAAAVYAAFTLTSRHAASGASAYATAFVCFLTGALVLLPLALASGGLTELADLDARGWLLVAYIGVVPTCVGYVCFFTGMQSTPATTSSIIVTLEPLFAAFLAWIILTEVIGLSGIIGAVILTAAVLVASRQSPAQQEQEEPTGHQ
ncbi:DMT family transporter [Marinobacter sp. BGYM27]|uniref:DMT family transporter n=1 Tax=Marinobacter sp. BGYM27 TaxID=2975597 RepID=UPI0021A4B14F|nr:DMT family transporter [Marinobacter sp. BGYM27]MDG5499663.1 DMT family transporter [Marinobacter sp. BGYM27]